MELHSAYLFDWRAFKRQAHPVVEAIDSGDFAPLLARARAALEHYRSRPDAWILHSPSNPQQQTFPEPGRRVRPKEVDFCFLLLVSSYLRPCPASLGAGWMQLSSTISLMSDNMRVGRLLTCGWSTLSLLRPQPEREPSRDGAGWLDTGTIVALQERLHFLWPMFARAPRRFTNPAEALAALRPGGPVQDWTISMHTVSQAAAMLQSAIEAGRGLFFTYAVEDVSMLVSGKRKP